MSGRRGGGRGRARTNKKFSRARYGGRSSGSDDRPAFDCTPFDSTSGESAWETLPTESIFDSTDCESSEVPFTEAPCPVPPEWLDSREHKELMSFITSAPNLMRSGDDISLAPRVARGYAGTASTLPMILERSEVPGSPLNSTIARSSYQSQSSFSRPSAFESRSTFAPGTDSRFAHHSAGSHCSRFGDDDTDEYQPTIVTSPPPPWNPHLASERLEDPDNPPPTFYPMSSNEWRTDPNISKEIRNMYTASCSADSGYHGIFNYGRLSEFNTLNLYDTERFTGLNEQRDPPAYEDCSEVFGDPYEAMARPTDDVPDKYRKQKWHYFELKKRLELFKKLGMERDLAMYEGQLERMEADPWTGDESGGEIEVYMPGTEHDPLLDDRMLEQMEALVAPENEGRRAFYAAMENLTPQCNRDMDPAMDDQLLERMEALVAPDNEGRRNFFAAMENPPPLSEEDLYLLEGRFPIVGDFTQMEKLTSYTDPGRRAFEKAMENPPRPRNEFADSLDEPTSLLQQMKQLVAPTNEERAAFGPATENPIPCTSDFADSSCADSVNLLEQMEQLVAPTNEGRAAFHEAMENPPPSTDEFAAMVSEFDNLLEQMEQLVAPTNEGLRAFNAAMENPPSGTTFEGYNDRLQRCFGDDDLEALVSPANEQRRAFFASLTGNASYGDSENSSTNCYHTCPEDNNSQMANSNLNTSFTLPRGATVDFPPNIGPDGC